MSCEWLRSRVGQKILTKVEIPRYMCVCVCLFLFIHIENTHWGIYYESPHKDRSVLVPACGWVCALPKSRCSRFQRPVWLLFGSLDFVNVDSVSAWSSFMSPLRDSKGNPAMLASLDRRLGNNTLPAHPLPFLYLQFEVYNKKKKGCAAPLL